MYECLIVYNKQLDVCPVGVRETLRQIFAKCVLKFMGLKATNMCQGDQICSRLNAYNNGPVHCVWVFWGANLSIENWGFLLVDAKFI